MPSGFVNEVIFGFFVGFGGAAGWALFHGVLSLFGRGK
jgi:hypothetical protein